MSNLKAENEPKIKFLDFWAFHIEILMPRGKIILNMLVGAYYMLHILYAKLPPVYHIRVDFIYDI